MRAFFLFLALLYAPLYALDLIINEGTIDNQDYAILHIKHKTPLPCTTNFDDLKVVDFFLCKVPSGVFTGNIPSSSYDFATINIINQNGTSFIKIKPKNTKASLLRTGQGGFDNTQAQVAMKPTVTGSSTHWMILFAQQESIKLFNKPQSKTKGGLNFDVQFSKIRPYIGSLDDDKKPLLIEDSSEVRSLLAIKKLYEEERYQDVITEVSLSLQINPDSLFREDFLLYMMRAYNATQDETVAEATISIASDWRNTYPSNANIPEVLYYLGEAYNKLYRQTEGEQILQEVIINYPDSKFAFLSKISIADSLRSDLDIGQAIALYEEVLYETQSLDVALMATERIAQKSLDSGVTKKAEYHYGKLIEKNMAYLIRDPEKAYNIAQKLISNDLNELAGEILNAIVNNTNPQTEPTKHAKVLFETAELYKQFNAQKAMEYYQAYINQYPQGASISNAKEELDKLIFNNGFNASTKDILNHIDHLIKTYPNQEIALRAFYRKMNIFYELKRFAEILNQERRIQDLPIGIASDKDNFLIKTQNAYAFDALINQKCQLFVQLTRRYKVSIPEGYDDQEYTCLYNQFRYDAAQDIANERLASPKEPDKIKWLYRLEKIFRKKLDHRNVIDSSEELLTLVKEAGIKDKKYQEVLYDLFYAYAALGNEDKMLKLIQDIEKNFPDDIRNMKAYRQIIIITQARLEEALAARYARELIELSNIHNSYIYSPWVDYLLVKFYSSNGNLDTALSILENLRNNMIKIKMSQAKLYYTMSDMYRRQGNRPQELSYLKRCANLKEDTWPKVCKDILKWID